MALRWLKYVCGFFCSLSGSKFTPKCSPAERASADLQDLIISLSETAMNSLNVMILLADLQLDPDSCRSATMLTYTWNEIRMNNAHILKRISSAVSNIYTILLSRCVKLSHALQFPNSFWLIWIIHYATEGKGGSWQWESRGEQIKIPIKNLWTVRCSVMLSYQLFVTQHCVLVSLQQDLCTFLISRACKNSTLANYLYWWVLFTVLFVFCLDKKKLVIKMCV